MDPEINDILITESEKDGIKFTGAFKTIKQEGNLVYEYNPFRNYRLTQDLFEYNNDLYLYEDLKQFEIIAKEKESLKEVTSKDIINGSEPIEWYKGDTKLTSSEAPILRRKGELVDFETNELKFDLSHPVNILPQYSYDNSVNLILNDGKNQPRLINSRFSATERNKYQIVDRKGDNDTNIYDQGEEFDIDTSLHKKVKTIPRLKYQGTFSSGNLSIGNYHFYFKYVDADGNESDFIAESGLVSIFIGNTPFNIHTGTRKENSHKGVSFRLENLDSGYQYLSVYYTVSTADVFENSTVSAFKIDQRYLINSSSASYIKVTGFEEVREVPIEEINLQYQIFGEAETQAVCQNRLFLGNTSNPSINYKELTDISLRFCPILHDNVDYNVSQKIDENYNPQSDYDNSYYNSQFIYNNVGYWPGEIYRFGIVYILNDGTLTPVFNVRGIKEIQDSIEKYTKFNYSEDRVYITYNEETNIILSTDNTELQENCKGVVRFPEKFDDKIYGISFDLLERDREDILTDLENLGIRGYFFVRQKRIPTILCQAMTIGVDKCSHTPVIPVKENEKWKYVAECFISDESPKLTHDYEKRLYTIQENSIDFAAICPDYDVDYPFYNTLFSGDTFTYGVVRDIELQQLSYNKRYYYNQENNSSDITKSNTRIQSVEDNQKLVAIDEVMFSARAGEAEEAFRYEYVEIENKKSDAHNLVRGSFGPFLGLKGCRAHSSLINIYIPNYNDSNLQDYFLIRYNDKSSFYAISDRFKLGQETGTLYRGDCYICQFTHRVNRNFQDPSAPTNDRIVDPKCWETNYEVTDGVVKKENFDKINLGDVNAIELGQWVTFVIRSSKNLNIRTLDTSQVDEAALVGHERAFFPYYPLSVRGVYKIPEALCYNKGFEKSLSERYNFEVPDVPSIKNDFSNRISYSEIQVTDAFQNGWRTFMGTHYRDYPKTYGSITKLLELQGNLLCVFEHGVALIPVNERTVAGEGSGGNVYINTNNVLPENPKVISDTFGSQWRDSIIKTPRGVYGVDTVGKKIWRTNGEIFECISDFRVQEFLNQNISLTERELNPIIGIRNVKTHYNKFKGDVMFTFYDNLHGFEEKVWNLCWNENFQKWITFYSWIPSYSENIYNQYFSFDRNTSKWITKLGISRKDSQFSDGIVLTNNEFPEYTEDSYYIGDLDLVNRNLPSVEISYELVRDNYQNYKDFEIRVTYSSLVQYEEKKIRQRCDKYWSIDEWKDFIETSDYAELKDPIAIYSLFTVRPYDEYCSEYYAKEYNYNGITYILDNPTSTDIYAPAIGYSEKQRLPKPQNELYDHNLKIYKDDRGRRINLSSSDPDNRKRGDKLIILLNVKAIIRSISNNYSLVNDINVDESYYESVIAVIPEYNMQFLTTDFWKHGQAGIIDIADKIYPTYWYGKQHPFEFEFVVADSPDRHKIFDSLEIISNKAAPESFHYEIVGECYDFAKDKKNMYIRQEATKELYQFNGSDIVFDPDYKNLVSEHRPLVSDNSRVQIYDKSTIFPLYYCRQDTINEIEDFYHLHNSNSKDFSALAGAEIVRYENQDEYRIWNHSKAVDVKEHGLLRGNMYYKEDKWYAQINPINLIQKNETEEEWDNVYREKEAQQYLVPAECNLFPPPSNVLDMCGERGINLPKNWTRNVVSWSDYQKNNREVKLKDKFIKIRIRYSGKDLAIISAIRTLYSISYA